MKRMTVRWLALLVLSAALYPGIAPKAHAQVDTTYNIRDIVEFHYNYGPVDWLKGKIATKCIGGTCGVLKWSDYTDDWQDGWITINLPNILHPGVDQSAPQTQPSPPGDAPPTCARPPC